MNIRDYKKTGVRKLFAGIMALTLLIASAPIRLSGQALTGPTPAATSKDMDRAEARILLTRLYDINAMDKSGLSVAQKATLGKEVRSINKRLHSLGGGVYISAGAVIVILILLILFL